MPNPLFRPAPPIEVPLAALHAPAYETNLTKRAEKWADELIDAHGAPGPQPISLNPLAMLTFRAGTVAMAAVTMPLAYNGHVGQLRPAQVRATEQEVQRRFRALVVQELKVTLRAQDVAAIWNDPDRMESERIWNAYLHAVSSIAFTKGNKEADFVRRWRDAIAALNDTDDELDARVIEGRLNRLTAPVKYPTLPEAAYEAAALLPEAERLAEVDRLNAKYAHTNGTTNGTAKRTLRKTRPLAALTN